MKLRLLLLTILIGFHFGCSRKGDIITIHPLKPNNKAFSAKVVKSIALSNQDEVSIGPIDKLVVYKDRIFC